MTTPTTPQDLISVIARAVADGATPDDRRAGRRAAMLLASTLGEPGEPMHLGTAPTRPTIDGAQLLDLAIVKMRAFLDEQQAKTATQPDQPPAPSAPTSSSSSSTATAATAPTPPPRPRVTTPPLRIPLIGSPRRP
jgi:hypothetical protein